MDTKQDRREYSSILKDQRIEINGFGIVKRRKVHTWQHKISYHSFRKKEKDKEKTSLKNNSTYSADEDVTP